MLEEIYFQSSPDFLLQSAFPLCSCDFTVSWRSSCCCVPRRPPYTTLTVSAAVPMIAATVTFYAIPPITSTWRPSSHVSHPCGVGALSHVKACNMRAWHSQNVKINVKIRCDHFTRVLHGCVPHVKCNFAVVYTYLNVKHVRVCLTSCRLLQNPT